MKNKPVLSLGRGFWIISLLLIAVTVQTGVVQSYAIPAPQVDAPIETQFLPPEALNWKGMTKDKAQTAKNPKLDSTMADLVTASRVSSQAKKAYADSKSLKLSGDQVHIQIVTKDLGLQEVIHSVISAGGKVTGTSKDSRLIQGWLPVEALESIAANQYVTLIRQPAEVVLLENIMAGSATSEGLEVINASAWHNAGFSGVGVKVGIIDSGFLGYSSLLGTDLPASVTVKNFVDGEDDSQVDGSSKHGTACAEIIYDIAPGASLSLAKISTNLDLQEAVTWLKDTQQVDIISTSLGWYNLTPGDGTGEFADLVQDARNAGILWITAAGNDRETHWGGSYDDPDSDEFQNFNTDQNINFFGPGDGSSYLIQSGNQIQVALRWNDWTLVDQDFDLYLYRWNGIYWVDIASSENYQDGSAGQTPTELATAITTGSDTAYGYRIRCYSCDRPINFEAFVPNFLRLDEVVPARSLANLADSPTALTVAALDVTAPYPPESYSAEGPTNGPGGSELGGFNKPDISGFANVSTVSYGSDSKFNGTSAATPHAAGAAALVLNAYPSFTPDDLQAYLQGYAVDMGTVGVDSIFGYGRLYLGNPPVSMPSITNISPNMAENTGNTQVTITGSEFLDGVTVTMTQSGQTDIVATSVIVTGTTTISADLDLSGAATGSWTVIVTNPDNGSAQLLNGFLVSERYYYVFLPLILNNLAVPP